MARVPLVQRSELPEERRGLLDRPIYIDRAMANSPDGLAAFQAMGMWIRYGSVLDPRLRELAIIQVGWLERNDYEYAHHVALGLQFGVTEADVAALRTAAEGYPTLDDGARAVLQAATQITRSGSLDDTGWAALQHHLGMQGALEIVVTISHYNSVVRILSTLRIELEPEYQLWLTKHPYER